MRFQRTLAAVLLALIWIGGVPSRPAHGDPRLPAAHAKDGSSLDQRNRAYFTDLKVLTHEGDSLRFYSDLLHDKIVAINFFYVNCPTAQGSLTTFFKLQKLLGDRLGKDFRLLTVSVDPRNDTLEAVQEFAGRYNPRRGWLFVTGSEKDMDTINQRLGNTGRLPEGHVRLFLLGNLRTGHWMKIADDAHEFSVEMGLRSLAEDREG